ncbi:variable surface protein, partial [Plasmodium gonderi]
MEAHGGESFLYNDDLLKELPSIKKYASFNNGYVDCKHANFYEYVNIPLQNEEWQKDVSNEIHKALCYIYNKKETANFNNEDCDYLYFWLNDIIYNNIKFQLHSTSVITVLKFLLQNNDGQNICLYDEYNINKDNYRDIKLLFDFSKDYDTLKNYFSNGYRFCNSDFQKYVNQYIIKYNQIKGMCNDPNSMDAICIAFKKFFDGKEIVDLREWKCNLGVNTDRLTSIEGNHENMEELSEPDVVHYGEEKEKSQEETLRIGVDNTFTGSISTTSYVSIGHSALRYNIDNPNNSSEFTVSKAMTIAPLLIGITVFSILFYKVIINVNYKENFTPFGYWVKKVLLGKSKRKPNIIMDRNIIENYTISED